MSQRSRRVVGGVVVCLLAAVAWRLDLGGESVEVLGESDPNESFPQTDTLNDGTDISVTITSPEDGALNDGSITLQGFVSLEEITEPTTSLALVVDLSGSPFVASGATTSCGDHNGDGRTSDVLDCLLGGVTALQSAVTLNTAFAGNVGEIGLVLFSETYHVADVSAASGEQDWIAPGEDADSDSVPDYIEAANSLNAYWSSPTFVFSTRIGAHTQIAGSYASPPSGGVALYPNRATSLGAAVDGACDLMATADEDHQAKHVIILSDGLVSSTPDVDLEDLATACPGVVIDAIAFGSGSSCTADGGMLPGAPFATMEEIAEATGGNCYHVSDIDDLADILESAAGPVMESITYTVDGGAPQEMDSLIYELPFPFRGENEFEAEIEGIVGHMDVCVQFSVRNGNELKTVEHCIDAYNNRAPVADISESVTVTEGEFIVVDGSGSSDVDGDDLSFSWEIRTVEGTALLVSGNASSDMLVTPSLDDGVYEVVMTVTDGVATDSASTFVVVENADPALTAQLRNTTTSGIVVVSGIYSDVGVLDTHTAVIDWGDGSDPEPLSVTAHGTGTGSLYGIHKLLTGSPDPAVITLLDDDGGTATASGVVLEGSTTATYAGVWVTSTSSGALNVHGSQHAMRGVRSDGGVTLSGNFLTITGTFEASGTVVNGGTHNSVPTATTPGTPPSVSFDFDDYEPGGAAALAAGSDYHNMTSSCGSGTWAPATLAPGLYYVPCDVRIGSKWSESNVTIVATGEIDVSGNVFDIHGFSDGLALATSSSDASALKLAGNGNQVEGFVWVPNGGVQLNGSRHVFTCGLIAETLDLGGRGHTLGGVGCETVSGGDGVSRLDPVFLPGLTTTVVHDVADVLPTETITSTIDVDYEQGVVFVPLMFGVKNTAGSGTLTVTSADVIVETSTDGTTWTELEVPLVWEATGAAAAGVSYDEDLTGTTVGAGNTAIWAIGTRIELAPGTLEDLIDTMSTQLSRTRVVVTTSGGTSQLLWPTTPDVFLLLEPSIQVDDVHVLVGTVDGGYVELDQTDDVGLAEMLPGDGVTLAVARASNPPPLRSLTEPTPAYLERLHVLDGLDLRTTAMAQGNFLAGVALSPMAGATSTQHVPILRPTLTMAETVDVGALVAFQVDGRNEGSAEAVEIGASVAFAVVGLGDLGENPFEFPETLLPGHSGTASLGLPDPLPSFLGGQRVQVTAIHAWEDAVGNRYGDARQAAGVDVPVPGALMAILDEDFAPSGDADSNGAYTDGDTVRYTLMVGNPGETTVDNVTVLLPYDTTTEVVASSATTTAGSVIDGDDANDTVLEVDLGSLEGEEVVTVTVDVLLTTASATARKVTAQASVSGDDVSTIGSDDPSTLYVVGDATVTRVYEGTIDPTAVLTASLAVDVDHDGRAGEGDVLRYAIEVYNFGLSSWTTPEVAIPLDALTTLDDTTIVTDGTVVTSDPDLVVVTLPTLSGLGGSTYVTFDVAVGEIPWLADVILAQGTVSTTSPSISLLTDDPYLPGVDDPTEFATLRVDEQILVEDPDGELPTIEVTAPLAGATIAMPTDLVATIAPSTGESMHSWRVLVWPGAGTPENAVVRDEGTGAPPSTLLSLDPSVLSNGPWVARIIAFDTSGRGRIVDHAFVVTGDYKPGRVRLAFEDASVPLPVGAVRVVRTYDTLDTWRGDDFGPGWTLSLMDMRVATNGPLGYDGWGAQSCGSLSTFSVYPTLCFESVKPHVVAVTWPDGRVEVFDAAPAPMTSFLSGLSLTDVRFVGRAGTTSKLSAAPGQTQATWSNPHLLNSAFVGGLYDPQQFVLTDPEGNKYLLDKQRGLVRLTDRFGNWTELTDDGVLSSTGVGVTFTRDLKGRIRRLELPDGNSVVYSYDASGDLVTVTDANDDATLFDYDGAHRLLSYGGEGFDPAAVYVYDTDGRLVSAEDATNLLTELSYDLEAFEIEETSPSGLVTMTRYGDDGYPELVVQTSNVPGETFEYGTAYEWNTRGQPTFIEHPSGGTEAFDYDPVTGWLTSHTAVNGVVTETTYGAYGTEAQVEIGGTVVVSREVDPATGQIVEEFRGDNSSRYSVTYFDNGLPERVDRGDGTAAVVTYDTQTLQLSSIDLLPDGAHDVVSFGYDAMGRQTSVTRAVLGTKHTVYDDAGQVIALVDANDSWPSYTHAQEFAYDELGRMVEYTDKAGNSVAYAYDDAGRLETRTNRESEVVTYTYDGAGRLMRVELSGEVDPVREYTYDALGRMLTAETPTNIVTWTHDATGVVAMTNDDVNLPVTQSWSYLRNAELQLTESTGPEGDATYEYDARGNLEELYDVTLGGPFTFGWDNSNRLSTLSRPNGATTTYGYNGMDRVLSMVTEVSSEPVHELVWEFDTRGRPESLTNLDDETTTYTHDSAGRLTEVDHPSGSGLTDEEYSYDAVGRRTAWENSQGAFSSGVVYNANDALEEDGSLYSYQYDLEGRRTHRYDLVNLTSADSTWDALDQLVELVDDGSDTWTFEYDALGRRTRVAKSGTGAFDWVFVYGANNLVSAVFEAGESTPLMTYRTGESFGEVLAEVRGATERYALRDRLGTTVGWLDDAGDVDEEIARDGYGNRAVAATEVVPFGYTGHAEDPTGLIWGRARYLDATIGAWTAEDPVRHELRYGYVAGMPVQGIDPNGTDVTQPIMLRAAVAYSAIQGGSWGYDGGRNVAIQFPGYTAYEQAHSRPWFGPVLASSYLCASNHDKDC
jgi:RHS repeat-associated protein